MHSPQAKSRTNSPLRSTAIWQIYLLPAEQKTDLASCLRLVAKEKWAAMLHDLPKTLQFLTQKQLAQLWNISERTLERWRVEGRGPPFVAIGPRRRGYRLSDIEAWASANTFGSTAAVKRAGGA
jgi:predicted DNA-binding transcriptional regulator AlpA